MEDAMKAYIVWTGSGPILVLTNAASSDDPDFVGKLIEKGIERFIATPVPTDLVEERYGEHYHLILTDRRQSDILRVVDSDGSRVLTNFSVHEMGEATKCEVV
jgi:response regulator RpfG family c-di-GMP phosphodiesterase